MQEIRKIFIVNKGLWILLLTCLLWIVFLSVQPHTQVSKEYRYYLDQVIGKIDKSKEEFIEQEAVSLARLQTEWENLNELFFAGEIEEEEYVQRRDEFEEKLGRRQGFEQIYEQYLYVCENKENRYFTEYSGWQILFSNRNFLLFASVSILLIVGRFLCGEYETNMDAICKTCRNSRLWLVKKFVIAEGFAGGVAIFLSVSEFLFVKIFIGLEQGAFPIQSIPCLSDSTRNLSCNEAFLMLLILRMLGCMLYSGVILLASSFVRKMSLTVCLSAAIQILPLFGFTGSIMYRLPLPISFMDALGYLKGSSYEKDMVTGEERLVFCEIPTSYIYLLIFLFAVLFMIAFICMIVREENKWERGKLFFNSKKKAVLSVLIFCMVLCGGCGKTDVAEGESVVFRAIGENTFTDCSKRCARPHKAIAASQRAGGAKQTDLKSVCYNTRNASSYEDESIKIYFEGAGSFPVVEDKETGEKRKLISEALQPMEKDCEVKMELFCAGDFVLLFTAVLNYNYPTEALRGFFLYDNTHKYSGFIY